LLLPFFDRYILLDVQINLLLPDIDDFRTVKFLSPDKWLKIIEYGGNHFID